METSIVKKNGINPKDSRKWPHVIMIVTILILFVIIFLFVSNKTAIPSFFKPKMADPSIDKVTKELASAVSLYDDLGLFQEGLAKVRKNGKYGFIDKLGQEIVPCIYDHADDYKEGVTIVTKGDKKEVIDKEGIVKIPFKYNFIESFSNGTAVAGYTDEEGFCIKYGIIDKEGNEVVPIVYSFCANFSEDLAFVQDESDNCGYVNREGKIVIPCKYGSDNSGYNKEHNFHEGLAVVRESTKDGSKFGYINRYGHVVIPFVHAAAFHFSHGLAVVLNIIDGEFKSAVINKRGELVFNYINGDYKTFSEIGLSEVTMDNGYSGAIDTHGNIVVPFKYEMVPTYYAKNDLVCAYKDYYHRGFYSIEEQREVIPCKYHFDDFCFREGLIPININDKYGFFNKQCEIAIQPTYDEASWFSEGFARVKRYGKEGYVDRYGTDTFSFRE